VIYFASPHVDGDALASAMHGSFGGVPLVGCTTAGEIGCSGFAEGSVVAMSLSSEELRVGVGLAKSIMSSPLSAGQKAASQAATALGLDASALKSDRHVALTLIDGRAQVEESFVAGVAATIPQLEIVGGSASDIISGPPRTRIFVDGEAHESAGLVVLFESDIPFATVVTQHLIPTDKSVVVTASEPDSRLVLELDGRPAIEVYGELVGRGDIDNQVAGISPFILQMGGQNYVRSVMAVEGNALRFACAVETGVVLRFVERDDLLATTEAALDEAREKVGGEIVGLIVFNCLGRYLEAEVNGLTGALGTLLARYPIIGFNTFGEQTGALHVNHTLTALAFGSSRSGQG